MCENEKVMITGLGRFEMKTVKEKEISFGGNSSIVPEHKRMKFYPSRMLSGVIEGMGREE